MALKYPNKCKRAGYWPAYEQARINDFRIVWQEICHVLPAMGRKACGRPPKLVLHELYCLCVFGVAFDRTLRELEADCTILLQKRLDHTNLSRWFSKLDERVLDAALQALHERMIARRKIEYITDSTPFTLSTLRSTIKGGHGVLEFTTWKLHVLLAYLPVLGLLSVASIHATHGDANDSPPFRDHVLPKARARAGCRLHADSAYYTLDILRAVRAKKLRPNIVQHKGRWHGHTFRRAREEYDNEARKKYRGLIEGFFGGLATRQGTKCRFKTPKSRNIFCHAIALAQQVRTYLRYKVLTLYLHFAPTPRESQGLNNSLFRCLEEEGCSVGFQTGTTKAVQAVCPGRIFPVRHRNH